MYTKRVKLVVCILILESSFSRFIFWHVEIYFSSNIIYCKKLSFMVWEAIDYRRCTSA
jgi:hypothetical protein